MIDIIAKAQAKGTDSQFRAWVQKQPSCLSGRFSEYLESGEGRNPACHVRRSAGSGTGYKEPYACIPLIQPEHLVQHQHGEATLLSRWFGRPFTREQAAEWFDAKRLEYLQRWIES